MYMRSPEIFYGQHEDASEAMFDHMLEDKDLKKEFKKYRLDVKKDGAFIKDLIKGIPRADYPYEKVCNCQNKCNFAEHIGVFCLAMADFSGSFSQELLGTVTGSVTVVDFNGHWYMHE